MEKEMICIVCPVGCHIKVNTETYEVKGNSCPRGAVYGKEELTAPKRVVTSTVKIKNALDHRCPIKTNKAIPKEMNFKLMEELKNVELVAPVKRGDIVIKDVFGTGADVVVTKDM
ncbi:DUF1667 domain-containing protein [Fusobacterium massiliense]|uniref:DUF1667 domain-containing protein n=1 Tax=Fusobacterium massiliense TaxID=1852365 RepID=UPI0009401033|nr:DUF1667 domain-containing protein [Fusobacterium massiliense]